MHAIEVSVDECIACDSSAGNPAHVAAYVYARYPSGVTAAFCAHHGREYRDDLIKRGATILDLSHLVHG